MPFALVVYLGLRGGGWGTIIHGEVAAIVWTAVLGMALAGVMAIRGAGAAEWVVLGLLAGLTGWTALGLASTESAERTVEELIRVGLYLAVFAIALAAQGRKGARRTIAAVGAAIAVLGLLALLSRLHPAWFPPNDLAAARPATQARLNYPLNYWNGVAALLAMGIPILLALAPSLRSRLGRVLAATSLPALALAIFFTYSRASLALVALAVLIVVLVHPARARVLVIAAGAALAGAVLIFLANRRTALADGLADDLAHSQGDEMIVITLIVCAVLAAAVLALERLRVPELSLPRLTRRSLARLGAAALVAVVVGGVALGASGEAADRWEQFKDPGAPGEGVERLQTASGNGRYQYWSAAIDALEAEPLTGVGPGTYQFWWTRNATIPGPIREAHSVYFESAAEMGIVGLLLIGAFMVVVLVVSARRALGADRATRGPLAGALAAITVFVLAAGFDWLWEIPVIPVAFLLLAAAALRSQSPEPRRRPGTRWPARLGPAVVAVGLIVVTVTSVAGTRALRQSQADARESDFAGALDAASSASSLRPYAATASVQEALVLLEEGRLEEAAAEAEEATRQEATNWQTWSTLSQIERARGEEEAADAAAEQAGSLNPESWRFRSVQ